jgi:hypothetical protein
MSVVAAAVIGSAALGAYSSNKASKRASADAAAMREQGEEAARLGREQFDWYKQEYERTRPEREAVAARDARIADLNLQGMQKAMRQADEWDQRNKLVYQPLENRIIEDANVFDTEAKREELAGQAMADVNRGFDAAEGQQIRALNASGVNPNSGAALALREDSKVQKALGLAGGANRARTQARTEGYARKMDAIGLGRGVVGNQATMTQLALGQGNSAVGAGGAGLNATYSGAPLMQQGFGSAMTGINTMSGLYGRAGQFQNSANYWADQRNSAIGGMLGVGNKSVSDAWASVGRALTGG